MKKTTNYLIKTLFILTITLIAACTQKNPVPIATLGVLDSNFYTVKANDSLQAIAVNYSIAPTTIITLNHLRPPYPLYIGQKLRLKDTEALTPPAHTISSNKTMASKGWYIPQPSMTKPTTKHTFRKHVQHHKALKVAKSKRTKTKIAKARPNTTKTTKSTANTQQKIRRKQTKSAWLWPTKGKLIEPYSLKGKKINKGIDIGGKFGQAIFAAKSGKVIYSGPGVLGYGNMLIVEHPKKILTVYANNKTLLVKEGVIIKQGQKIATMGKLSSQQTGLHFELRRNGRPLNPLKYLKA